LEGGFLLRENRDHLGLVAAILEAAGKRSNKTHIMYLANLNYKLSEKYLAETLRAGLIQKEGFEYFLTEQGRNFLIRYKHLQNQYLTVEQEFSSLLDQLENSGTHKQAK
jgi:predicted transcriptional regulator